MNFLPRLSGLTFLAGLALAALFTLTAPAAHAQAFSDYVENKVVDLLVRNQAFTPPATTYVALATGACADAGITGEVSGNGYARVAVASALANWAGTQGAGTTAASTGTGGQTSNNATITFAVPSGSWGTVATWALFDAASAGNLLLCAALTANQTISTGNTVSFAAGALTLTVQ